MQEALTLTPVCSSAALSLVRRQQSHGLCHMCKCARQQTAALCPYSVQGCTDQSVDNVAGTHDQRASDEQVVGEEQVQKDLRAIPRHLPISAYTMPMPCQLCDIAWLNSDRTPNLSHGW